MKSIFLTFLLSIGLMLTSWSQITEAEYFIDTDPGVGNATDLSITSGNSIDTNFNIPTVGLSNGLHVLHIRVKGTDDVWSLYYRDYFYILTNETPAEASNIGAAEYFIDSDPGVGNGTALTIAPGQTLDDTFNINTNGLSNGLHVLHIRVKDLDNTWSLFYRDYFYIHHPNTIASSPITAAEYFFDSDPGVGNGFSVPITQGFTIDETLAIPVPMEMTDGSHYLYIRVKNMDDIWSTYIFALFNVDSNLSVNDFDDNAIKVFPNPTNSVINIEFNAMIEGSLELFDVNGKKIMEAQTNDVYNKIDVSNFTNGIYFLHIIEKSTFKRSIVKIIKS